MRYRTPRVAVTGAAVLGATVPLVALVASPAAAVYRDAGDDPAEGLGWVVTLLVYAGIPLAVFALVFLSILAPPTGTGGRYRPGVGWWAQPVWFNGPDGSGHRELEAGTHTEALQSTAREDAAERAAEQELSGTTRTAPSPVRGGGASARW